MDARNDDSPGSDYSLDKSLQKKCVVDDVGGHGEGVMQQDTCSTNAGTKKLTTQTDTEHSNELTAVIAHKTDKNVGDGGGGGGGAGNGGGGSCSGSSIVNCHNFDKTILPDDNNAQNIKATNETISNAVVIHNEVETLNSPDETIKHIVNNRAISINCSDESVGDTSATTTTTINTNNNNNAFETKVKQIAQNLKETTLAETEHTKASLEMNTNTTTNANPHANINTTNTTTVSTPSSSSSSSSSTSSLEFEPAEASSNSALAESSCQTTELNSSLQSANETTEDQDHRSKKVRFHPDVKENDGGNRVISKKKKKIKTTQSAGGDEALASTSAAAAAAAAVNAQRSATGLDDDMDMDEEDESAAEEEEDFDLAKTIAEAEDYLKIHPLTFARAQDKTSERLRNGLLDEEDLPQLAECSEEDDFYDQVPPENGVERILGKQTKAGKVEFLLRYIDKPGLFWEQEDVICKNCPNLLNKYEICRERRQERLMRHVAKRQNIRQRYTDF